MAATGVVYFSLRAVGLDTALPALPGLPRGAQDAVVAQVEEAPAKTPRDPLPAVRRPEPSSVRVEAGPSFRFGILADTPEDFQPAPIMPPPLSWSPPALEPAAPNETEVAAPQPAPQPVLEVPDLQAPELPSYEPPRLEPPKLPSFQAPTLPKPKAPAPDFPSLPELELPPLSAG